MQKTIESLSLESKYNALLIETEALRIANKCLEQQLSATVEQTEAMLSELVSQGSALRNANLLQQQAAEFTQWVIDSIGSLVIVLNETGKIKQANRLSNEVFGKDLSDMVLDEFLHPDDFASLKQEIPVLPWTINSVLFEIVRACGRYSAEHRFINHLGQVRYYMFEGTLLHNFQGKEEGVVINAIDITLLKEQQQRLILTSEQLQAYQLQNESEQKFANAVLDRMLIQNDLKDPQLQYWKLVAQRFSGDLICVKRVDANRLYFMVADVTGHGLSAALPTLIVYQVFRGAASKEVLVSNIAETINHRIVNDLPVSHFVALAVGLIDNYNRTIEIWNGGLPDILAVDAQGNIAHNFKSRHVFAGILNGHEFDRTTELWQWQEECELFVFSDGAGDVKNHNDQMFGMEQVVRSIQGVEIGRRISNLRKELIAFMDEAKEQDDISCLCIHCH
jgi:PAS domain S-box-containing protein